MTTIVLDHLPALSGQVRSMRMLLARLGRKIDALASAKAARTVPEWQLRKVQGEISRHRGLIRAAQENGMIE